MDVPSQGNKSKSRATLPLQRKVLPQDQPYEAEWQELEHDRALIHFLVQTIIRALLLKLILQGPPRLCVTGGMWGWGVGDSGGCQSHEDQTAPEQSCGSLLRRWGR